MGDIYIGFIGSFILIVVGFALAMKADNKWGWLVVGLGCLWAWYVGGENALFPGPMDLLG